MLALALGPLSRATLCHLDHLPGIHQRRQLGCAGLHHPALGCAAFPRFLERADHEPGNDGDDPGGPGGVVVGISDTCSFTQGNLICPSFNDILRGEAFFGNILAVIGAVMAAGYVMIGRRLRGKISLLSYITLVYGMAAIVLIAIMLSAGQPAFGYPAQAYIWLFLLALIPQLLGHTSFNWALSIYLRLTYPSPYWVNPLGLSC